MPIVTIIQFWENIQKFCPNSSFILALLLFLELIISLHLYRCVQFKFTLEARGETSMLSTPGSKRAPPFSISGVVTLERSTTPAILSSMSFKSVLKKKIFVLINTIYVIISILCWLSHKSVRLSLGKYEVETKKSRT